MTVLPTPRFVTRKWRSIFSGIAVFPLIFTLVLGPWAQGAGAHQSWSGWVSVAQADENDGADQLQEQKDLDELDAALSEEVGPRTKSVRVDTWALLNQTGFTLKRPERIRAENLVIDFEPGQEGVTLLYQGEPVLRLSTRGLRDAVIAGPYLVIAEDGRYFEGEKGMDNSQTLAFVDLRAYEKHLGRGEEAGKVPVFRLRAEVPSSISKLSSTRRTVGLQFEGTNRFKSIPLSVFAAFSEAQQGLFTLEAKLLDPDFLGETSTEVIDALYGSYERAVDATAQSLLDQTRGIVSVQGALSQVIADSRMRSFGKDFDEAQKAAILSVVHTAKEQRRWFSRAKRFWRHTLSLPQPTDSVTIQNALAAIGGYYRGQGALREAKEIGLQIANHPYSKFGTGAALTAVAYSAFPEQTASFLKDGVTTVQMIADTFFGRAHNFWNLAYDSMRMTIEGISKPWTFYDAYLAPGKLQPFLTGVVALSAAYYGFVGTVHVLANSLYLAFELRNTDWNRLREENQSRFKAFEQALLEAQERMIAKVSPGDGDAEFDREAFEAGKAAVEAVRRKSLWGRGKTLWGNALGKVTTWLPYRRALSAENPVKEINERREALTQFLLSPAAFYISGRAITKAYNRVKLVGAAPSILVTSILFPQFTAVATSHADVLTPTQWDGGTEWVFTRATRRLLSPLYAADMDLVEEKIIEIERKLHQVSLEKTFEVFTQRITGLEEAKRLAALGGNLSIDSEAFDELTFNERRIFRDIFYRLYEESTDRFIRDLARVKSGDVAFTEASIEQMSERQIKDLFKHDLESLEITAEQARRYVNDAASPELLREAEKMPGPVEAVTSLRNLVRQRLARQHGSGIGPGLKDIVEINRVIDQPKAFDVLAQSLPSKFFVDPMVNLGLSLLVLANVTKTGVLPFDPAGGEGTLFNMSILMMWSGFVFGSLQSAMSYPASRLLQTYRVMGGDRGAVPDREEAEKGLAAYMWKKFWPERGNNKVVTNQFHYVRSSLRLLQFMFLFNGANQLLLGGRFDIDSFVNAFLLNAIFPSTGALSKYDQVIDQTGNWIRSFFPENIRNSREVDAYVNREMAKLKVGTNLPKKLVDNILWNFVRTFHLIVDPATGHRAFSFQLYGANIDSWIKSGTQSLAQATEGVPGLRVLTRAVDSCAQVLLGPKQAPK